ncbi:MAG: YggS family pyridoxal phosphate-dependent enzyme [bacterium]|nr:YggS family pyridoxal phosphate-dependent enzyme [bacterium]
MTFMSIKDNLDKLEAAISGAAERTGRKRSDIKTVVVSKTHPTSVIREAIEVGVKVLGENRVQEARAKIPELADLDIEWHLVGHLQRNKVKYVLPLFSVIQSLDSLRLARAIEERAVHEGIDSVECFLQVNTSGEDSKFGVASDGALSLMDEIAGLERLSVNGFMTIGPLGGDERAIRKSFGVLRDIRDKAVVSGYESSELSMGMSSDFEVAIEEGATVIRVGRVVFGERKEA